MSTTSRPVRNQAASIFDACACDAEYKVSFSGRRALHLLRFPKLSDVRCARRCVAGGGSLRAAILNASNGSPLPGRTVEDSVTLRGDDTAAAVSWGAHGERVGNSGTVRIEFVLEGQVDLFSFALGAPDV